MKRFKNLHKGGTCCVIGNGPSLDHTSLDRLAAEYKTLGSNQIYRLPFTPDYYSIIDREMLAACLPLPESFTPEMFLRAEACTPRNNPIYPIVVNGFSVDIDNFVVMGGTVTYALLQIAFYMGFETVLLVGVDHYYPKSSRYGRRRFVASGNDPDHFRPHDGRPYFLPGRTYNPPELDGVERYFAIAKDLYTQAGRRIVNLTPNSRLNVFEKDEIERWL